MSALLKRRRVAALQSGLAETVLSHHEEHEAHGAWRSADFRRFRFMNQEEETGSGNASSKVSSAFAAFDSRAPAHSTCGFPIYVERCLAAAFTRLNCPCPICVDPWLAFLHAKKAAGIFFVGSLSSTARSRRRVGRRFSVR